MSSWSTASYFAGVATWPAAFLLLIGIVLLAETGTTIECAYCGYSTGPMRETSRLTRVVRWRWHKLWARRITHRCGVSR